MIKIKSKTTLPFLLILSIIFISTSAFATTYYVDATNGLDNNAGTSENSAWKTIAKINASKFNPGDQILFKSGETWRGTVLTVPSSGASGNPITFSNYGSGAQPIISGSVLLSSGWTVHSGNIYQVVLTTQPNIVYFNGIRGSQVASAAAITSQYQWCWASNVLYAWSPSGAPSACYATPGVEAGSIGRILQTNNQSYVTFSNLIFQDANNTLDNAINVGSTSVTGIVFSYCTIQRGASAGINLKGSTTAHDVTIDHCIIQNNGAYGILVDNTYTTATVSNNTFSGNGWRSVTDNLPYADITSLLSNFNIFGNTFTNVAPDGCTSVGDTQNLCHSIYSAPSVIVMNVYNNIIHGNTYGDGIKTKSSARIYDNWIYGNSGSGVEIGSNGTNDIVVIVNDNIINGNGTNNNQGGGIEESGKGPGTLSVVLENNSFYQNSTTLGEIRLQDNITSFTSKNNIIYAASSGYIYRLVTQSAAIINNNLIYGPSGNPIYYNGASRPLAIWKGYGFDTEGVNASPLFTNGSESFILASDFILQSGSPAIHAGVSVGLITDYAGNPVQNPPSIGAYEYGEKIVPTAPANLIVIGQ
jgi:hypothetical protein